jgi:hypothetical protein
MMRGYPGSKRCRSNPCPTRNGKDLAGVEECGAWPSSKAVVVAEADTESLGVFVFIGSGRREKVEEILESGLLGERGLVEIEIEEEA